MISLANGDTVACEILKSKAILCGSVCTRLKGTLYMEVNTGSVALILLTWTDDRFPRYPT